MLPRAINDSIRKTVGHARQLDDLLSFRVDLFRNLPKEQEEIRCCMLEQGFSPNPIQDDNILFAALDEEFEFWQVTFTDTSLATYFKLRFG